MVVETSFIHPSRSSSVMSMQSPRQMSRSRRRGIDSSDNRSPSEIGIAGAEVVKVLKGRGWEVCEPKGLEEYKRYYRPGGRAKGKNAKRSEDFVVGEGELYAYVLEKGGISYLFPNAGQMLVSNTASQHSLPRDSSVLRTETTGIHGETISHRSAWLESGEDTDLIEYFSEESSISTSRQHQKKRRKKQKTSERVHSPDQQAQQETENAIIIDDNNDTDSAVSRDQFASDYSAPPETNSRRNHCSEAEQYALALKTKGNRTQLLKDVDLNLMRSVAEIAFRQTAFKASDQGEKIQELERFSQRIQVAKNCLSYTVADIAARSYSSFHSDTIDSGIDIPNFVSTGPGRLVLMQDIERYILLVGQTLRQFTYIDHDKISQSTRPSSKTADLRPLQRHIDKTTRELLMLSVKICGETKRSCPDNRRNSVRP